MLVHTTVPEDDYVNAVTDAGLRALDLPVSYPVDSRGHAVAHAVCQPIGQLAWEADERGIACRSATPGAPAGAQELAYFGRGILREDQTQRFVDWYL